jgi:hypothetical protein
LLLYGIEKYSSDASNKTFLTTESFIKVKLLYYLLCNDFLC